MPEKVTKEINGTTFILTPFGAREGMCVLARLVRLVDLGEIDKSDLGKEGFTSGLMLDILRSIQRSITSDIVSEVLDTFEKQCNWVNDQGSELPLHKVGKVHHADRIFACNYNSLMQWFLWCLDVNYSSFFGISPEEEDPPEE